MWRQGGSAPPASQAARAALPATDWCRGAPVLRDQPWVLVSFRCASRFPADVEDGAGDILGRHTGDEVLAVLAGVLDSCEPRMHVGRCVLGVPGSCLSIIALPGITHGADHDLKGRDAFC